MIEQVELDQGDQEVKFVTKSTLTNSQPDMTRSCDRSREKCQVNKLKHRYGGVFPASPS